MADRVRLVGAVNGVLATGKRHGGDAHWIARRTAGDHLRQMGLVTPHLGRRRPSRVRVLAADVGRPRPLLADPANSNRIADGLAGSGHVIEPPLLGADDDRARSDRLLHRHHVAARVRRVDGRQTGSADGRHQDCKQSLFHSLTLNCYTQKRSG